MRSHLFALQDLLDYVYHTLTDKPADPLMAQICGYIASHLYEDITIDCLYMQYLINHTALTRRFRTYTGKNINVYINDKKLEMVKLQLVFTELTLKEIASLNGYATSPYLIRLFKAKTSLTPLVYRKRC